ncbi:MAG: TIM barrel protein [Gemmatimonadaceae bacterium]|nr:TIM barrel protein [Gemmatimonadaceae bacterium]
MERREMLAVLGAASAAQVLGGITPSAADAMAVSPPVGAGRLKQSVCRWCYQNIPLDVLCRDVAAMGFKSVELLSENEWATLKPYGLTCAVANGPTTIPVGFNRLDQHDRLVAESERLLPLVAAAGIPQMIVFSGNRAGMPDAEGLANCVVGLRRIMPLAEQLGVTVIMELLNSKVDHKDYMCDHTAWGVELAKRVGSPRFKLLYDIYHMQIMEGDVIRTLRDNFAYIGHVHTGGVPGRHEIDDAQELNYPQIMRSLAELGYSGYVAQEFIPERAPMVSLKEAFTLCNV